MEELARFAPELTLEEREQLREILEGEDEEPEVRSPEEEEPEAEEAAPAAEVRSPEEETMPKTESEIEAAVRSAEASLKDRPRIMYQCLKKRKLRNQLAKPKNLRLLLTN